MDNMHRCLGCMEEFDSQYSICPYCGYEIGTPPKEAYHMIPGTMLAGRYLVGQVLGFGGFGVTYIGYDVLLNRKVAFKEYLPSEFATRIPGSTEITTYEGERFEQFSNGLNKFMDEAKMLAKFQASNGIVQIYDSFQENGTAYIVMEYLEGRTLKEYLEQVEKVSVEEAKEILHPILVALQDVHELGILHRDIAPDNIFLTSDGKVKLLDFGASRFATTSHSKSLSVIIKPGYAPVEQYRSRGDQGTWTDVYSLAATFYKMITGITPEDSMERIEKEELKKPSKLGVKIPKNVENAIMNALNIRVEDRTQTVSMLEKQLYSDKTVKLHLGKRKKADVGRIPLWFKIVIPLVAISMAIFSTLLATGVIKFYRIIPESFILAEGKTRIPNLINEDLDNAEQLTKNNDLALQVVNKQFSEYIPEGLVIVQYQDKGQIVNVGDIVEVVVSGGREIVFMPDLYAYSLEQAMEMLNQLGITVSIEEEYGDIAVNSIMKQSIVSNEQVFKGDTIVLTVSKGFDTLIDTSVEVETPDIVGKSIDEAITILKELGLYIRKVGVEDVAEKPGYVTRQNIEAGTILHQGDVVEIYVQNTNQKLYMPDVQYKDIQLAQKSIENMGLKIQVEYQESETVAKGKVISQSVEPYKEVKSGDKIKLVVSNGSAKTNNIKEWSEWVENLPTDLDKNKYDIERKKMFAFRDMSTTTSYSSTLDGWEMYDKQVIKGEYGPWSAWSTDIPATTDTVDIHKKTQYSSQSYETMKSNQPSLDGWNRVGSEIIGYSDYSSWSEWSTNGNQVFSTPDVEYEVDKAKNQYRFRDRSKETTWSSNSSLEGWTATGNRRVDQNSWSGWSGNTTTPPQGELYDVQLVQDAYNRPTGTYNYHTCRTAEPGSNGKYHFSRYSQENGESFPQRHNFVAGSLPDFGGDGAYSYYGPCTCCGIGWSNVPVYLDDEIYVLEPATYRYRQANYEYEHYRWLDYGAWSDFSDEAVTESDSRQVESRQVYRNRSRNAIYQYSFERWSSWTNWSDNPIAENSTTKVRTQTIYQYRDIENTTVYYFRKWGKWSEWRVENIEKTSTRDVKTNTFYRYREK